MSDREYKTLNTFEVSGNPQQCAWKSVAIMLLEKNWSFTIDFDDENRAVYIDTLSTGKRLTFEQ